jgi:malate dehydrogenase (oxaloacetate-decarboxylating)(NADP+)
VFPEGDQVKILKAAQQAYEEGIATPILLGNKKKIAQLIKEYQIDLPECEIIDPKAEEEESIRAEFAETLFERRKRKGMSKYEAFSYMRERNYFGAMLVDQGRADAMITGLTRSYRSTIKPILQIIGLEKDVKVAAGMYILNTKRGPLFLADTTVNISPSAEELAELTYNVSKVIRRMKVTPRVALLSYSNFGSSVGEDASKMSKAVKILHEKHPGLVVDGEMQANFALNAELLQEQFPFSSLVNKEVNTLIFPNLASGNITYKTLQEMMDVDAMGPVLIGMRKSVHILQLGASVREIINMVKVAVIDAQNK